MAAPTPIVELRSIGAATLALGLVGIAPLVFALAYFAGFAGHHADGHRVAQRIIADGDAPPLPYGRDCVAADSDGDMEALLSAARELYVRGEYAAAAEVVEPATRVGSTAGRAWRLLGATSCFEHDARTAARARDRLDPRGRDFVRYVCARNDIKL